MRAFCSEWIADGRAGHTASTKTTATVQTRRIDRRSTLRMGRVSIRSPFCGRRRSLCPPRLVLSSPSILVLFTPDVHADVRAVQADDGLPTDLGLLSALLKILTFLVGLLRHYWQLSTLLGKETTTLPTLPGFLVVERDKETLNVLILPVIESDCV